MPRLFISCVSDEFGNYRDALRKDFTRANVDVKVQEDFVAYGDATMEKLDEYIQRCDVVIHIAGDMTGSNSNHLSLQYINDKHKDFAIRFPNLIEVVQDKTHLSYTQWEAYLALYHRKRLFIVKPTATAARNEKYIKDDAQAALQQAHLKNLQTLGYYAEIHFSNEDELAKKLYQSKLGEIIFGTPRIKPINLPYHSIGTAFKGRKDFITALHETLNKTTGITAIAIHALGGMGKTRLAVEYAWQYKNDYTGLLFVNANSPELLTTNIANLAEPKILNLPEHAATEEEIKYNAVINWLNQYTGWLLILDNADTTAAVKNLRDFLSHLQHGHIIITSRIDNWASPVKHKELKILDRDSAVNFLLESTNDERKQNTNDGKAARSIAKDLGYLALALDQAKSYINTNEISFEDYRTAWEANHKAVLEWYDELQTEYPASVAITWQTSFNQLSADAITLLNRLCWLAPEPIPKTLLDVEIPDAANIHTQGAWTELKQYSLTASTEDKTSFTIHKLVQDVTKSKMNETLQGQTLTEALKWVNKAFIGDVEDVRNWPYLEPLIPHVLSLAEYAQIKGISEPTGRFINDIALIFLNKAQYNTAEPLMRKVIEIFRESLGENHPDVATGLNNLATLLRDTDRLQEAEALMRRALEIDEQSFGANHPNVARDLNNLATLLRDTDRLQEAEALMRRALEIDKQSFGANHPNVARDLNNLATLLRDTNRLQEAEALMRRTLEIDKQSFGANHPNVAGDLNNLAILLQATNRLQEAEPLMRRALEIDEQSFGANHPNVARDLNNLAQLLQDTNRLQEAEPLMRRALDIDTKSFGENHPNVAIRLGNLALWLKDTNRLLEAEPLMRKAFIIFLTSRGFEHPNTQTVGNNYIYLLEDMGKSEEEIQNIFSTLL